MDYLPEWDAMTQSALAQVLKMTDEKLEQYQKLMITRGTPAAGVRSYGYSDILGKSAELSAAERAKYGVMGLEYGEKKRQYDTSFEEQRRQFGVGARQKEREMTLFEQQLKDLKNARANEQKNWWKKYLGQALGIGAALLIPGAGKFIGAGLASAFGGEEKP